MYVFISDVRCGLFQTGLHAELARCLRELPDDVIDQVVQGNLGLDPVTFIKATYMRCHLVGVGAQPLAWLNPAIEAAFRANPRSVVHVSFGVIHLLAELLQHSRAAHKSPALSLWS